MEDGYDQNIFYEILKEQKNKKYFIKNVLGSLGD